MIPLLCILALAEDSGICVCFNGQYTYCNTTYLDARMQMNVGITTVDVLNGTWTEWDTTFLPVTSTSWISYLSFHADVRFVEHTIRGSASAFECENVYINSPDCHRIDSSCFALSRIKTFRSDYITEIGSRAFSSSSIERFDAPRVEFVKQMAFRDCLALKTVTLGTSVQFIGKEAFGVCSELESITIGFVDHAALEDHVFDNCGKLTKINLSNVNSIGVSCFNRCRLLETIELAGNASVGQEAFSYCESLISFQAPAVESIGSHAFIYCLRLMNVALQSATSLPYRCFASCTCLAQLEIPRVRFVNSSCFVDCYSLTSINYDFEHVEVRAFSFCCRLVDVTLRNVHTIGDECFFESNNVKNVQLDNLENCGVSLLDGTAVEVFYAPKLKTIPTQCFRNCLAVKNITIPACETIENNAFEEIGSVNLTLPNLRSIGAEAFKKSYRVILNQIGVLDTIGDCAFSNAIGFKFEYQHDVLNLSVRCFGVRVFENCDGDSIPYIMFDFIEKIRGEFSCKWNVTYADMPNLISVNGCPFRNLTNLEIIKVPKIETCFDGIARNCVNLYQVEMSGLVNISGTLIKDCPNITTLGFESLISCGSEAFMGMTNLVSINIPACVEIGDSAFSGCVSLKMVNSNGDVDLNGIAKIGASAFQDCKTIQRVFGMHVRTLANDVFHGCSMLEDISDMSLLEAIGSGALKGCKKLESVMCSNVKKISNECFMDCERLKHIDLSSCTDIEGDGHFANCGNLVSIDLRKLSSIDNEVALIFKNCLALEVIYLRPDPSALSFAESVFVNTGRQNRTDAHVVDITLCLSLKNSYTSLQKNQGKNTWKGISIDEPADYENVCKAIAEIDPEKHFPGWAIGIITSVCVVLVAVAGFFFYKKIYLPAREQSAMNVILKQRIELGRVILDDFG